MWRRIDPLRRAARAMRGVEVPGVAMDGVLEAVWTGQPVWPRRSVAYSRGYAAAGLLALVAGALALTALPPRFEPWPDGWHRRQLHVKPKALADLVGPNIHADALAALERVQAAYAAAPRIHKVQYGGPAHSEHDFFQTWIEGERCRQMSQAGGIIELTVDTGRDGVRVTTKGDEVTITRGGVFGIAAQERDRFVRGLLNIHLHGYIDEVSLRRARLDGFANVAKLVIRGRNRIPVRKTIYFDVETDLPILEYLERNTDMNDRYDDLVFGTRVYYDYPDNIDDRLFDVELAAERVEAERPTKP